MKTLSALGALLCLSLRLCAQQPNLIITQTSTAYGLSLNDRRVTFTGVMPDIPSNAQPLVVLIDQEAMLIVESVSPGSLDTAIVQRAYLGTAKAKHYSGSLAYIGIPSQFGTADKSGACQLPPNSPQFVNVVSQLLWACVSSTWTSTPTGTIGNLPAPLPVIDGGTGTGTPSLVPGNGIGVTGSFPNQTVALNAPVSVANGGTGSANPFPWAVNLGGTGTATPTPVAGAGIIQTGTFPNITTSTIYNGLDAYSPVFCPTPNAPTYTCITNAFAAGISNTVIASSGATINGTIDVPSNQNLTLRAGTYTLGNNGKLILEAGSTLTCPDGPYATIISVPQTYAVTDQVITLNGSVTAMQTLRGCQIKFYVPPGATSRAGVIQYTAWAIGGPQPASFLVDDFVISGAWNAINLNTGANNGKVTIRDTIVSSFNRMIDMDYLVDTVTLSNVKGWPIGLLNTQYPAFFDPLNIAIRSGRVDDLKISDSSFDNGQCMNFYAGTGGQTVGTFTNTSCDTNAGVTMSAGDITWTGGYFSIGNAAARALNMTGGIFIDNGIKWGIVSTTTDFQIQISGPAQFYKNGGYINTGSNDVTAIGVSGTQAYVSVVGSQFLRSPNIAYVNPTVTNTGTARLMLANNFLTDKGTGTAYFVTQTTDGFSTFVNNALLGWSMNLPGTFTSISYQNNSGLGPSSFGVQSYSVYPFSCPGGQHAASMSGVGVITCN